MIIKKKKKLVNWEITINTFKKTHEKLDKTYTDNQFKTEKDSKSCFKTAIETWNQKR